MPPFPRPRESKNDKTIYVELTIDLESDCDVTISVTCRISTNTKCYRLDLGVDFTIFEVEELDNDETIYV